MQTSFLIKIVGVNLESDLKNRVRGLQFWGKFGAFTPTAKPQSLTTPAFEGCEKGTNYPKFMLEQYTETPENLE